jgi:hypothetical protein
MGVHDEAQMPGHRVVKPSARGVALLRVPVDPTDAVRYLGIEVDDALEIAEQTDV